MGVQTDRGSILIHADLFRQEEFWQTAGSIFAHWMEAHMAQIGKADTTTSGNMAGK